MPKRTVEMFDGLVAGATSLSHGDNDLWRYVSFYNVIQHSSSSSSLVHAMNIGTGEISLKILWYFAYDMYSISNEEEINFFSILGW